MKTPVRPLIEVTEEALTVLSKQLGVADTMRFLGQFTAGQGDYTEERKDLFGGLSVEDIVAEIRHDDDEQTTK